MEFLSQKPPAVPPPDPLLQQMPSLSHNVHRCLNHVGLVDKFCKGLSDRTDANASISARNFQAISEQITNQNKVLAFLKGSNDKLQAQNAKLEAKVGGLEFSLKNGF